MEELKYAIERELKDKQKLLDAEKRKVKAKEMEVGRLKEMVQQRDDLLKVGGRTSAALLCQIYEQMRDKKSFVCLPVGCLFSISLVSYRSPQLKVPSQTEIITRGEVFSTRVLSILSSVHMLYDMILCSSNLFPRVSLEISYKYDHVL